ncbi:MAG: DUF2608 domain-containing protein [Puniceicoccales bacterium]|jgi:hypothetical protein|nr:DUF2608 domain-containing protein [Puniceicoccales bacterium]
MIISTDTIDDIAREVVVAGKSVLFAFDCDEVLTTLSEQIWKQPGCQFLSEWCKRNIPNVSEQEIYDVATSILVSSENFLVNQEMPRLVRDLKSKKARAVVLTALSTKPVASVNNPMLWRVETLRSLGYNFRKFWPRLRDRCFTEFDCRYPPAYSSGVVCCGNTPKGASLEAFLGHANVRPGKVVFIDDKIENVEDVGATCKRNGIEFSGIEYHGAKNSESQGPFSEKILEYQLATLLEKKIWISDREIGTHLPRASERDRPCVPQIRGFPATT